jgi:hypothetical protein
VDRYTTVQPMGGEVAPVTLAEQVLPVTQRTVLRQLAPAVTPAGFYLAGGTAVAIQLGHRQSLDLDWFTEERLGDPLRFAERLRRVGVALAEESFEAGTLHAQCDGVPVSFLEYRYPSLAPRIWWAEYGCELASLPDLACMKLSAVAGRGARKDFIDIFAIGTTHLNLAEMLDLYRRKYDTTDIGHVVMSLSYFDDAEAEDMPRMVWQVSWAEVKRSIERWVIEFTG